MFKYGRMQKKISPWLVCGSHGTYLDYMLPEVEAGIFSLCSCHDHLRDSEDFDSLL